MEYGTPNLPGIAGLNAGVKWVLREGVDIIGMRRAADDADLPRRCTTNRDGHRNQP